MRSVRHSWVLAKRNLVGVLRNPEALIDVTLQPVIFIAMFTYIFGGAIAHGSQHRYLQLDKTRFRNTLADCTVTICEHLDGGVSVRWGPHLLSVVKAERGGGKDGATGALEISPTPRDSHFPHRPATTTRTLKSKAKTQAA